MMIHDVLFLFLVIGRLKLPDPMISPVFSRNQMFVLNISKQLLKSGGDVFGKHVDGSNQTALGRTEYTLLVYLTGSGDGLEGGQKLLPKSIPEGCDL